MFNRHAYENSRPVGIPTLERVCSYSETSSLPGGFAPLQHTSLCGEISGPLATLSLRQQFAFSRYQFSGVLEALYRFPLPGDAAVTGVIVRFGDTEIEARLEERKRAEAQYEEAKREGRQAALATRESPDVFTLRLAGIAPGEPVYVETRFVVRCRALGAGWDLRIPLTTAPRFAREDEAYSRQASGQPFALLRDPGHRSRMELLLRHAESVRCTTHRVTVTPVEQGARITLAEGEVVPDRDFVLTWVCARDETRPALHVNTYRDTATDQLYLLGFATPPRRSGQCLPEPREVLVLVDHSGSMSGAKWEAANQAVRSFLTGLNEQDTFNLELFHSTTRWYSTSPVSAKREHVDAAVRFLHDHRDTGGTELGVALEQALRQPHSEGNIARHIVLITDAEVTDAGRILRLVEMEAAQAHRRRVSIICIDAAPNSLLVHELAARGGGSAHFLTSAAGENDVASALSELLAFWSAPFATGLRLECDGGRLESPNGTVPGRGGSEAHLDLGELPADRPQWFAARLKGDGLDQISLRLTSSGRPLAACRVPISNGGNPALKALFGARRVLALEYLMEAHHAEPEVLRELERLGYAPAPGQPPTLYPENRRGGAREMIRSILVREALAFGLASSETAFVAVRKEAGKLVDSTIVVANALPHGWSARGEGGGLCDITCALGELGGSSNLAMPSGAARYCLDDSSDERDGFASGALWGGLAEIGGARMQPAARFSGRSQSSSAHILFSGAPDFQHGSAVLYDSTSASQDGLGDLGPCLRRLRLQMKGLHLKSPPVPSDLVLLIYVGDFDVPRVRIPVCALLRQGELPLDLTIHLGEAVMFVLEDPSGFWSARPPRIELRVL